MAMSRVNSGGVEFMRQAKSPGTLTSPTALTESRESGVNTLAFLSSSFVISIYIFNIEGFNIAIVLPLDSDNINHQQTTSGEIYKAY